MNKPIYVFRCPSPISTDAATRLRNEARQALGDPEAIVMVLGDGMTFEVVHHNSEDTE